MRTSRPAWRTSDQGAVAIVVAIFMFVALILLAFVVDRGAIYVVKGQMQNAVDAAALAAGPYLCSDQAQAEQNAYTYADSNQVDALDDLGVATGKVLLIGPQAGSDGATYLTVRTAETVPGVFGPVFGSDSTAVAVQATIKQQCTREFQFIADSTVRFSGNGDGDGSWWAAKCFQGDGGTFEYVAVGVVIGFNCNAVDNRFDGPPPIQDVSASTPRDYEIQGPSARGAVEEEGWDDEVDAADAAFSSVSTPNCKTVAIPASTSLTCNGTSPSETLTLTSTAANIFAQAPIDLTAGTVFTGQIIYSAHVSTSETDPAITLNNGVPAGTIVYAPYGTVKFTGSNNDNQGKIFAKDIWLSGGNQVATSGTDQPVDEDPVLIQ